MARTQPPRQRSSRRSAPRPRFGHIARMGATGPVGQRVVRLLARHGGHVRSARVKRIVPRPSVWPFARTFPCELESVSVSSSTDGPAALDGRTLVIAAARREPCCCRRRSATLPRRSGRDRLERRPTRGDRRVDLNDKGIDRENTFCYGALGVGGTKMKIHKAAIGRLFMSKQRAPGCGRGVQPRTSIAISGAGCPRQHASALEGSTSGCTDTSAHRGL